VRDVGQCPFCAGEVSEDILLFGGTCPHCFGLIPGDEAATDPGEAVKQELETADKRRAQRRAVLPLLITLPLVTAVAAVSIWFALRPEPELAVLDFDDAAFTFEFDFLADDGVESEPEPSASGTASVASSGSGQRQGVGSEFTDKPDFRVARLGAAGQADGADGLDSPSLTSDDSVDVVDRIRSDRDLVPSGLSSELDLGFRAPSVSAPRAAETGAGLGEVKIGGAPLASDAEIRDMIKSRLSRHLKHLASCYTTARNARPDLAGDWVLEATVQTDGSVGGVSFQGQGITDDVLETCVIRQVERWRFEPIVRPVPFKKTLPFRPR